MKTMKQFLICLSLLCVMVCFYSCSNEEVTEPVSTDIQQNADAVQKAEMEELISFIEELNANIVTERIQTRGRFWDRIKRILLGDAYGWGWGVNHGFPPKGALIPAAVFSIISAFSTNVSGTWRLNNDWKVYTSPRWEYEIIGNDHNKVIYDMMINDRTIASGTFTNEYLCNSTNKKLMSYGYSNGLSSLQNGYLLGIISSLKSCTTVEQLNTLMRRECPQSMSEFEFVERYVEGLVNLGDKSSVRSYTQRINTQIDSSSLGSAAISRLKTMVAIAENSKALWSEVN